jgi:uncharacterized membrane protein
MALVSGAGLGAGLMYLLDPDRGSRRRARLGDAMTEAADTVRDRGARLGAADVVSGARLAASDVVSGLRRHGPRMISELAAAARDPRRGRLTLRRRGALTRALDRYRWSLLGVAAGVLAAGVWGLWRREPGEVHESITVNATPERVYEAWSSFESFPRFMPAVREVRTTGADRTHWVVSGPAGRPVEFESMVTRREPPHALAWRTVEGSLVSHGGTARFRPVAEGRTRIDVTMWWQPPAGALGQGAAALTGVDPGQVLRQGLDRFRAELEQHGAKR